jgi:pyruvate,water dikinase
MGLVLDMAAGDARLGGKARSLVELAECGLPVPAGFVIADDLFRALCPALPALRRLDDEALARLDGLRAQLASAPLPPGFSAELGRRLGALGAERFAVRSSFAGEDRPGHLAAGVFESRLDLPAASVERAIREVLGSALAPGAVAYALAAGEAPARAPLAVLVHAYVAGSAEGSAALAAGGSAEPLVTVRRGELPGAARQRIGEALARLVDRRGPVEVEWVLAEGRVLYLQARPFVPPPASAPWAGWAELGGQADRTSWHWDASHNPLPLSAAQAGLVRLVDGACSIGVRQRVLGGYLFYARDERPLPPPIPCEEAAGFFATLDAEIGARLAALGDPPGLEAALDLFVSAYQPIFGVLQPALREADKRLHEFLAAHAPAALAWLPALRASVPSRASERRLCADRLALAATPAARERALAEYLGQFGHEAASWDVAAPTYAEEPEGLLARLPASVPAPPPDWRQRRARVEEMLAPGLQETWRTLLALARTAVGLGEDDDWLYARTQAAVRRALLATGRQLVERGAIADAHDVFALPLPLSRSLASGGAPASDLRGLVSDERRAWQAALAAPPPSVAAAAGRLLRGVGTGGRALGRVVLHQPGARRRQGADAVLVATTLLPTELPLLSAVALVTETGGVLDHVAAQARERGIPAVVSAHGATASLADGDLVLVDGDRGLVVKL